MNIVLKKSR